MQPVDDIQKVTDVLFFWQGYDPSVKIDLCSCALRSDDALYFIDPIPLAPEALAALPAASKPAGIILTNGNHGRAAAAFRKKFAVPVFAHLEARGEFDFEPDHWIGEGKTLPGRLVATTLPGAARGEIAIYSAADGGTMVMGDALINLEPHGFAFLPGKYCSDAKRMRQSLRKLLQFSFEAMTFAHGLPVPSGARTRLEQLLSTS